MPKLQDKVAVVTGGARGIGRAIAEAFVKEGASVAIVDAGNPEVAENTAKELSAYGTKVKAYLCSVTDFAAVKETVDAILADFSGIDILVNNAGITRDKLILMMKEEDFDAVLDVNLKGAFCMTRHVAPVMVKKRAGRIINISSISGIMGNAGQANYSASKAGIIGLTKSTARELASRNILCNAIAPGFIETDMTKDIGENNPMAASIPLKRRGKPEDVARVALFLASEDSSYITGEVIRVDGGLAI